MGCQNSTSSVKPLKHNTSSVALAGSEDPFGEEEERIEVDQEEEEKIDERAKKIIRKQKKKTFINNRSKDNFYEFLDQSLTD